MQLNDLMTLFVDITVDCDIAQLGPPFSYYYADVLKSNLLAKDVFEVDVKSAFPTICKLYFGEEHPFVKSIFAIDSKLERNIFIATTLKQQAEQDGGHYLNELNLWSKILVLGYTYCRYEDVSIIQYVKDGVIIRGKLRDLINTLQVNTVNGQINLAQVVLQKSEQEEEVINHTKTIFYQLTQMQDINDKKLCIVNPMNSKIAQEYSALLQVVQYNQNINYMNVFLRLDEDLHYLPFKRLLNKYISELENKRLMPHIHYIAFLYECMRTVVEINL